MPTFFEALSELMAAGRPLVTVTVVALVAGCVILPVPIVLGYGLRAAEREDRQRRGGDGRGPRR